MRKLTLLINLKPYIITAFLAIFILLTVFKIYKINIGIPLNFSGDAIVHYNFAKNIQKTGWWINNPDYSYPTGQSLTDFPLSETIPLLLIKLLIFIGLNWYLSINVFYIFTFPLAAIASLYVLKKFGIKNYMAIPLSLIYAFIPYHLLRGVNHLFLASYFSVPLAVLIAYKFAVEECPKFMEIALYAFLIASNGVYYTFFSCFFIIIGLVIAFPRHAQTWLKSKPKLTDLLKSSSAKGVVLLVLVLVFLIINVLPTIFYNQTYGTNLNATVRSPSETELYGLKIIQLILPIEDHNISFFNKIYKKYSTYGYSPTINENQYSSLGLVSTAGFLILVYISLFRPKLPKKLEALNTLALFNLASILLATTGGFSLLMSVYLSPSFRSVNRISIFIAFFALLTIGLILQNFKNQKRMAVFVWIIFLFALFDQISIGVMRNFLKDPMDYYQTVAYAKEIEKQADSGAKIYTLPYGDYPEGEDKKLLRIALLTENLKWSAGSASWRANNYWQYTLTKQTTDEFLKSITNEGFTGLLIYVPNMDTITLTNVRNILHIHPVTSSDEKYQYFDLRQYINDNHISPKPSEVFYYIAGKCRHDYDETSKTLVQTYCVNQARIELDNKTNQILHKKIKVNVVYPNDNEKQLVFDGDIPIGTSHLSIKKDLNNNKVFQIPYNKIVWPINIGYPNIIVRSIEIN